MTVNWFWVEELVVVGAGWGGGGGWLVLSRITLILVLYVAVKSVLSIQNWLYSFPPLVNLGDVCERKIVY